MIGIGQLNVNIRSIVIVVVGGVQHNWNSVKKEKKIYRCISICLFSLLFPFMMDLERRHHQWEMVPFRTFGFGSMQNQKNKSVGYIFNWISCVFFISNVWMLALFRPSFLIMQFSGIECCFCCSFCFVLLNFLLFILGMWICLVSTLGGNTIIICIFLLVWYANVFIAENV